MRLVTFTCQKRWRTGLWTDAGVIDLYHALGSVKEPGPDHQALLMAVRSMRDIIALSPDQFLKLRETSQPYLDQALKSPEVLKSKQILIPHDHVKLQAPLPHPGKVICVGMNYSSLPMPEKPDYPTIFLKPSSTITGPNATILLPQIAKHVACEVELALVVGSRAHNIAVAEAEDVIFGYTIANDLGDRQIETWTSQWTSGKMLDTFTPIGPWISTPEDMPDVDSLWMRTWINGQGVQEGRTSDMLFKIPELLVHLSKLTTLHPGDLVLTGSPKLLDGEPSPVRCLTSGDQVTVMIEGLGEMDNLVMEEK
jgi:acylpyruvate hydrolase